MEQHIKQNEVILFHNLMESTDDAAMCLHLMADVEHGTAMRIEFLRHLWLWLKLQKAICVGGSCRPSVASLVSHTHTKASSQFQAEHGMVLKIYQELLTNAIK